MIKAVIIIICLLFSTIGSFAQTRKTPVKSTTKPPINKSTKPLEIAEKDWNEMIKNLESEDWNKSSLFISNSLTKLKTENDKKQLARLRYFYLYSLAGKVVAKQLNFAALEKISESLIGKDFLLPPRSVLSDCQKALNYVCPVKDFVKTARFTASNKNFDAIHSFEYVQLPEIFEVEKYNGKFVLLGGKLKKVEFNPKKETSWIMRLYFENGTIEVVS